MVSGPVCIGLGGYKYVHGLLFGPIVTFTQDPVLKFCREKYD